MAAYDACLQKFLAKNPGKQALFRVRVCILGYACPPLPCASYIAHGARRVVVVFRVHTAQLARPRSSSIVHARHPPHHPAAAPPPHTHDDTSGPGRVPGEQFAGGQAAIAHTPLTKETKQESRSLLFASVVLSFRWLFVRTPIVVVVVQ